jgi:hypothetical protein
MYGLGLGGGSAAKFGGLVHEDNEDKENESASTGNEDLSAGFVSSKRSGKKKKSRRSSIGLETLAPIDLGVDEMEDKEVKKEAEKDVLGASVASDPQNPNDVSDLMSFEEVEALHKESGAADMPPPPPRTPQHASSGIGGGGNHGPGSGSGSGKKSRKKKKGGSTGKRRKNR